VIPYLILTAVLSGSICWALGHRTARIRVVVIGATAAQDQAAIRADLHARFDAITAGLELPDIPDQEQQ
jgi:hypothetical protein